MTAFLGVDQTGATTAKGVPKPLPAALLERRGRGWRLTPNLRLRSLRPEDVEAAVGDSPRVLIVVDAVLGLPRAVGVATETLLSKAKDFTHEGKPYGRATAARFFAQFLDADLQERLRQRTARGILPARESERLANANSVFLEHPFQRNVGCGSFRILKELARDPRWFSLWPHEAWRGRFHVAEGYPSLYWRRVLGARTRDGEHLRTYLRQHFPAAPMPLTADDADAVALALGGRWALETGALDASLPDAARHEGWILGLEP
jgi:hypothetical protein